MALLHINIEKVVVETIDNDALKQLLDFAKQNKLTLNKVLMTQEEAIAKLNANAEQLAKVKAEVQKLVDAGQNQPDISPELEAAITAVSNAIQGVDDLNADVETPA